MPRGGNSTSCLKHGITDCIACAATAKSTAPAPTTSVPAPTNTRVVEDVRSRLNESPVDAVTEIEGLLNDGTARANVPVPAVAVAVAPKVQEVFDTLPTDDSHASKVARAAAAYAKESVEYAQAVVAAESLKAQLKIADARVTKAAEARLAAENEMKELLKGELSHGS